MDPVTVNIILTLLALFGVGISIFGFPGMFFIFLAALIYVFQYGFDTLTSQAFIILGILTVFSFFVDNLAAMAGAKRYGASKYGIIGAFAGGFIGLFTLGPVGILVGSFFGAVLAELVKNPDASKALSAGLGAFIGYIMGILFKFLIAIGAFIWLMFVIWS